jgi:hypothetical protein
MNSVCSVSPCLRGFPYLAGAGRFSENGKNGEKRSVNRGKTVRKPLALDAGQLQVETQLPKTANPGRAKKGNPGAPGFRSAVY